MSEENDSESYAKKSSTSESVESQDDKPPATTPRKGRRNPTGFRMAGGAKEQHGQSIYCISWSTDVYRDEGKQPETTRLNGHEEEEERDQSSTSSEAPQEPRPRMLQCVATCGGNHVTLYEVEVSTNNSETITDEGFILRQAYVDPDDAEVFYACAFGGRCLGEPFGYGPISEGSELGKKRSRQDTEPTTKDLIRAMVDTQSLNGPQLLCVGGSRGIIKIIDPVRKMLFMTLSGHGNDIYDLKFSPTDEWLLLSASKDESLRLWNVKTATCVAIFAGHEGHRDSVLSLGWHPSGDRFASAGMDTSVKLWDIGQGSDVQKAIQASCLVRPRLCDGKALTKEPFRTIYEQMPYFSTNKVHVDYVDCVQFVGDLVLSKSITNSIVLWKPDLSKSKSKSVKQRLPNEVVALREYTLNKCDVWFIRFQTDAACQMLAVGNNIGEIKVWDIDGNPKKKHFANLVQQSCTSTVRMVAFSPDAKYLVAACDDSTLWKWNAT